MRLLIYNIQSLIMIDRGLEPWIAGSQLAKIEALDHSWLIIEDDKILDFGPMDNMPVESCDKELDAQGRILMPAFVDSHTHLVYAESRQSEFVDKIKGLSYAEIAARGGGILNSARRLQNTSMESLLESTLIRAEEIISQGTGAVEIKSGYGLTLEDELKMLRVAKKIGEQTPLTVKTTFLGAHAIPKEYKNRRDYIDLVINQMIPQVAHEGLADYCDVFCEKGFFSPEETEEILNQGIKYGLKPKIHANQLHRSGGVQVGVKLNAISVDHLETIGKEEIDELKGGNTMATLLPGAAFFLNMQYPPAREMIKEGLALAIASDMNPGSSPSGNMQLMISLACIKMKMTPEEALNAATFNGAYAMEVQDTLGSIKRGKKANLLLTKKIPDYAFIPYAYGSNVVEKVILNGKIV